MHPSSACPWREIDEWMTDESLMGRLDEAALTRADLDAVPSGPPVRPGRWGDHILPQPQIARRIGRSGESFRQSCRSPSLIKASSIWRRRF